MSDNAAVYWSGYTSHLREVEGSIRVRIAEELLEYISFLDQSGTPECFVKGVEKAREVVLLSDQSRHGALKTEIQERLF